MKKLIFVAAFFVAIAVISVATTTTGKIMSSANVESVIANTDIGVITQAEIEQAVNKIDGTMMQVCQRTQEIAERIEVDVAKGTYSYSMQTVKNWTQGKIDAKNSFYAYMPDKDVNSGVAITYTSAWTATQDQVIGQKISPTTDGASFSITKTIAARINQTSPGANAWTWTATITRSLSAKQLKLIYSRCLPGVVANIKLDLIR